MENSAEHRFTVILFFFKKMALGVDNNLLFGIFMPRSLRKGFWGPLAQ